MAGCLPSPFLYCSPSFSSSTSPASHQPVSSSSAPVPRQGSLSSGFQSDVPALNGRGQLAKTQPLEVEALVLGTWTELFQT